MTFCVLHCVDVMARADSNNVSKPLHIPVAVLMNSVVNASGITCKLIMLLVITHTAEIRVAPMAVKLFPCCHFVTLIF